MEVRRKLLALKATIQNRVALGFRALMPDEEWVLVDARDDRVDADCRAVRGNIYRGDTVQSLFPQAVFLGATTIRANVHFGCRCTLEWVNVRECVAERLRQELVGVAGSV